MDNPSEYLKQRLWERYKIKADDRFVGDLVYKCTVGEGKLIAKPMKAEVWDIETKEGTIRCVFDRSRFVIHTVLVMEQP